jgi:hypothetical protein
MMCYTIHIDWFKNGFHLLTLSCMQQMVGNLSEQELK